MSGVAVAVMPAILLVAAGPALEAPASAVASSAAIAATIAATVGASAPTAAVPAAAAKRPLETGARIAAYARGLAREFAERFRSLSRNARACFTRKQNNAIVNKGGSVIAAFVRMLAGFAVPFMCFMRLV